MKKIFCLFSVIFWVLLCCSCSASDAKNDVIYVCVRFDTAAEREGGIGKTTELLATAENKEEAENALKKEGYQRTEKYYEDRYYDGLFLPAGYYPTYFIGEGEKAVRFIVYPTYIYRSLEEYEDARYGSFFYEIIKKMEERD